MMTQLFIGLMSGTSMDAIDAVLVDFAKKPLQLIASHSEEIPTSIKQNLQQLCFPSADEINRLGSLDVQMGQLFATACNNLLKKTGIKNSDIVAIGSHGQTIRHQPNFSVPFTLQIGDPNVIAELTGITTVADFRRRDIACGGQGAPLVPAFHHYFFHNAEKNRVIVNIGGIANITILPNNPTQPISGFDTGPGNTLLDAWIKLHKDKEHDQNGAWAESGKLNSVLLKNLLADPYLQKQPPKSTGREYFNLAWLKTKLPQSEISPPNVQNTLTEFTAVSIMQAIENFAAKNNEIIICGGGIHNDYLITRLKHASGNNIFYSSKDFGIDPDWLEAIAFAWLAKQTLAGETGNLPNVTGAKKTAVLGGIYRA